MSRQYPSPQLTGLCVTWPCPCPQPHCTCGPPSTSPPASWAFFLTPTLAWLPLASEPGMLSLLLLPLLQTAVPMSWAQEAGCRLPALVPPAHLLSLLSTPAIFKCICVAAGQMWDKLWICVRCSSLNPQASPELQTCPLNLAPRWF